MVTGEAEVAGGPNVAGAVFKTGGREGGAGAAGERGRAVGVTAGLGRGLRVSAVGCRRGCGGGGLVREGWRERLGGGSEGDSSAEPVNRSGISLRASGAEPNDGVIASCHGFGAELSAGLVASCQALETVFVRRGGGRFRRSLMLAVGALCGDSVPSLALGSGRNSPESFGGATGVSVGALEGSLLGWVTSMPARIAPDLIRKLGGRIGMGLMIASSFLSSMSLAFGMALAIDARRTAFSLASNSSTSEFVAGIWLSSLPSLTVPGGGTNRRLTGGFAETPSGPPAGVVARDAAAARAAMCDGDCCRLGGPVFASMYGIFFSLDPLRAMAPRPAMREELLLTVDSARCRVAGDGPGVVTGARIGGEGDAALAAASAPLVLARFGFDRCGGGEENARDAPRSAGLRLATW